MCVDLFLAAQYTVASLFDVILDLPFDIRCLKERYMGSPIQPIQPYAEVMEEENDDLTDNETEDDPSYNPICQDNDVGELFNTIPNHLMVLIDYIHIITNILYTDIYITWNEEEKFLWRQFVTDIKREALPYQGITIIKDLLRKHPQMKSKLERMYPDCSEKHRYNKLAATVSQHIRTRHKAKKYK